MKNNRFKEAQNLFIDVAIICFFGLIVYCLVGCSSMEVKQIADPNTFYKRDMSISVNGRRGIGVVVAPKSLTYKLELQAFGQLDLLTYTSCHRDKDFLNVGGYQHSYEYTPVQGIEATEMGSCPVVLGGYDKPNGRHSWGQVIFEDPMGLEALVHCNAEKSVGKTSACQNLEGQITKLDFQERVKASPDCEYSLKESADGKSFTYRMPARECAISFCTKDMRCHNHFSIGYKQQLVRGK